MSLPFLLLGGGFAASAVLGALPACRARPAAVFAPTLAALWGAWLALTSGLGAEAPAGDLRLDDIAILIGVLATLGAFLSLLLLLKPAEEGGLPAGPAACLAAAASAGTLFASAAAAPRLGALGLLAAIAALGAALALRRRRDGAGVRGLSSPALAGMFAAGATIAGAGFLLRLLSSMPPASAAAAGEALAAGAGAAMAAGSLAAAVARNPRRLLGWLCLAQAGFACLSLRAVAAGAGPEAAEMSFLHLAGFLACSIGAFGALEVFSAPGRPVAAFADLSGLWRARPFPAAVLAISVLGLCGLLDNFHMRILPLGAAALFGPSGLGVLSMASEVLAAVAAGRILYSLLGRPQASPSPPARHHPAAVALAFCALAAAWLAARPDAILAAVRRAADAFRP